MKKVLITGANSYIGTNVEKWLIDSGFQVDTIDMIDGTWKNYDFSKYDVVYHVAGIAHDTHKKKNADLYYKVNTDLPWNVAIKAKKEGVKQFIFMSSMLIYNGCREKVISKDTKPKTKGCYGDSKLQADIKLQQLNTETFKVCIIRPPMIFGPNCKGNFPKLCKLAKLSPIFPNFSNERSMLYIDNLCYFVNEAIKNEYDGIYCPQNAKYFSSTEIIKVLSDEYGKKIFFTKLFNWMIYVLRPVSKTINKVFGDLKYDDSVSQKIAYVSNEESIRKSKI